jgi:hypothetical protein
MVRRRESRNYSSGPLGKVHMLDIEHTSLILIDPILRILNWEWNGSNFDDCHKSRNHMHLRDQLQVTTWHPHWHARPLINLATTPYSEEEIQKILDIQCEEWDVDMFDDVS